MSSSSATVNSVSGDPAEAVPGTINYVGAMHERARFHAQDNGLDNLVFNPQVMSIRNARTMARQPSLVPNGVPASRIRPSTTRYARRIRRRAAAWKRVSMRFLTDLKRMNCR